MKFLRKILDAPKHLFEPGGKLEKLYPLYEAGDTFAFTPGEVTKECSHVRDGIDLKRTMITVIAALVPCIIMAMYNTGLQIHIGLEKMGIANPEGWRADIIRSLGFTEFAADNILLNFIHGALYFIPVFIVCNIAGGFWEALFALVRKHEINEGFLVTGMLFPLILPPNIPLWQVAVGISFGVVIGKEVFGGTGRNILNPALTARVFLFFAYPAQISGDQVWVAVDGYSAATPLGVAALEGIKGLTAVDGLFLNSFIGFIPGSMGETSALACVIGAFILIASGIGSWQIMLSATVGMLGMASILYGFHHAGMTSNPMFSINPLWHFVLGGFAFGIVFMATDPVTASMTPLGKYIYGFCIGCMGIIVRSINPAFPEGWMLAILFMNVFAPLIDHFVMMTNIKRRKRRVSAT